MRFTLYAAGIYNLTWGAFVVLFPPAIFQWAGMPAPNYPEIWQAVGMLAGVYGVGYLLAAGDPARQWPMVAAGLLGKVLGPVGFLAAARAGRAPWGAGWAVLANDVIWWAPFGLILREAWRAHVGGKRRASPEIQRLGLRTRTQYGVSLEEISKLSPVLLVFLRHAGCTFCRETLADLAEQRKAIEATGTRLALVHMGSEERAPRFFGSYGLEDVPRVSDPERALYRAFGLGRGGLGKLLGPKVWVRGFQSAILERHGFGALAGDGLQMPGVFLLFHGEVLKSYRHQSAADRPDYLEFVNQGGERQETPG